MIDHEHTPQASLSEQMGDAPEMWSREFAKRFALVDTDRRFCDTLNIMRAWFHGLRANVLEVEAKRSAAEFERAFEKHTEPKP